VKLPAGSARQIHPQPAKFSRHILPEADALSLLRVRIPSEIQGIQSESPSDKEPRPVGNPRAKSVLLLMWGGLDAVATSLFHEGSSAKPPSSTHSRDCGRCRGVPASVHAGFVTFNRVPHAARLTGGMDRCQSIREACVRTRGVATVSASPRKEPEMDLRLFLFPHGSEDL
jgi:hypothetical protein